MIRAFGKPNHFTRVPPRVVVVVGVAVSVVRWMVLAVVVGKAARNLCGGFVQFS